jgi:hypothetical protein
MRRLLLAASSIAVAGLAGSAVAESRPVSEDATVLSLGAALAQGFEIKAQAVKSNILVITVQKGGEAYICASNSDLVSRIFDRKPVSATCVPLR